MGCIISPSITIAKYFIGSNGKNMHAKKALLGCLLALISNSVLAQHVWSGVQGNASHTGFVDVKFNPKKMHLIWSRPLKFKVVDDRRRSSKRNWIKGIMIANQTVYIGLVDFFLDKKLRDYPTGSVIALDATSGNEKWQQVAGYNDLVAEPVYAGDNRVIVGVEGNDDNQSARLIAYHGDNGMIDYSLPIAGYSYAGPQEFNGNLYTQTMQGLSSIHARTGKLNWTRPFNQNFKNTELLAVDSKYIIQSYNGAVEVSDNTNGAALFIIKAPHAREDQPFPKIPVYDEKNQMVYHGFRNDQQDEGYGSVFAFDLASRTVKWHAPNQLLQPVLAGKEIYVIGEGKKDEKTGEIMTELHALDTATGKQTWSWQPVGDFKIIITFLLPPIW